MTDNEMTDKELIAKIMEHVTRIEAEFEAGIITEEQYQEVGDMLKDAEDKILAISLQENTVAIKESELDEALNLLDKIRTDLVDLYEETKRDHENFDFQFWNQQAYKARDNVLLIQDIMYDLKRVSMGIEHDKHTRR